MNLNRLIDRIVREAIRHLLKRGVDTGVDFAATRRLDDQATSAEKTQPRQKLSRDQKQKFRQAQRISRQMRKFIRF